MMKSTTMEYIDIFTVELYIVLGITDTLKTIQYTNTSFKNNNEYDDDKLIRK